MDAGIFAQGDPKLLTFAIMGAINWIPLWFKPSGNAKADDVAKVFADYLVGGLIAPGKRGRIPDTDFQIPRLLAFSTPPGQKKPKQGRVVE